jgi:hypothetical protein
MGYGKKYQLDYSTGSYRPVNLDAQTRLVQQEAARPTPAVPLPAQGGPTTYSWLPEDQFKAAPQALLDQGRGSFTQGNGALTDGKNTYYNAGTTEMDSYNKYLNQGGKPIQPAAPPAAVPNWEQMMAQQQKMWQDLMEQFNKPAPQPANTFNFELPQGRYELFPTIKQGTTVGNTTTGQQWTPGVYKMAGGSDNSGGGSQEAINQILRMIYGAGR